jgi:hypothetical protein
MSLGTTLHKLDPVGCRITPKRILLGEIASKSNKSLNIDLSQFSLYKNLLSTTNENFVTYMPYSFIRIKPLRGSCVRTD